VLLEVATANSLHAST